jgi:hypothetical protein
VIENRRARATLTATRRHTKLSVGIANTHDTFRSAAARPGFLPDLALREARQPKISLALRLT